MPANRNALIRYKTIDLCLQNRFRKWKLEDLIEKVSDALYEYEGKGEDISKRTIQLDIQNMRSDKLGYNAPIIVVDRKYYTYEEPSYTITKMPMSNQDLEKLSEAVDFLKQFQGFSHFEELRIVIQKMEDHVYTSKSAKHPIIVFETNPNLKGLEFLDPIYKAILKRKVLSLNYKSFKASRESSFNFHPFLLKEFNNRWFLIGQKNNQQDIMNLALDRIISMSLSENLVYRYAQNFNPATYFLDIIGVTVSLGKGTEKVVFKVDHKNSPYIITKPVHHSQTVLDTDQYGVTFELTIQVNPELERVLLGFGEGIEILYPSHLKRRIVNKLKDSLSNYDKTK